MHAAPITAVAAFLGHRDRSEALRTYGHLYPGHLTSLAPKLDGLRTGYSAEATNPDRELPTGRPALITRIPLIADCDFH